MAKRAFHIRKLVKAAQNEICYEQDGETIYLCDKRGYVGIQTDVSTVLADLEKYGAVLTEKPGLKQMMKQIMEKDNSDNMFVYTATGIQFPYWDSFAGKKKTLTMFRDYKQDYSVKLADAAHTEIFDPTFITGGKSFSDPIIMICTDCFGVIMPIRANRQYTVDQRDNVKHLLDYFNNLR